MFAGAGFIDQDPVVINEFRSSLDFTTNRECWKVAAAKQFQGIGIAFLTCGISFFAVGVSSKLSSFWPISLVFIALGVIYLVKARQRPESHTDR